MLLALYISHKSTLHVSILFHEALPLRDVYHEAQLESRPSDEKLIANSAQGSGNTRCT